MARLPERRRFRMLDGAWRQNRGRCRGCGERIVWTLISTETAVALGHAGNVKLPLHLRSLRQDGRGVTMESHFDHCPARGDFRGRARRRRAEAEHGVRQPRLF